MNIILTGRVPSKKNSRITVRKTGMSFPSKEYTAWHKDAMKQLQEQCIPQNKVKMVEVIALTFFAPDKRASDLTNKTESIMDLLVDYGFIEDDNWYVCPEMQIMFGGVDKENPRVEITVPIE